MERLKKALPQYFDKDGNFKLEEFKEMLSTEEVDLNKEGYGLDFLGKSYAKYESALETETVLTPDIEHNEEEINTDSENLYIVGDNLDGLKHLLKSYSNKIKTIYIDPPYNTGSDGFVYPDDFSFNAKEMSENIGIEEDEAKRILNLAGKSTHSAWLTFMYPRLILARDLLSDGGVIFISIDENEHSNLKLLSDEIFGEENYVCEFVWRKKTGANDAKDIAVVTEPNLCYTKNKSYAIENNTFARDLSSRNMDRYNKKDQYAHERGRFYYDTLDRGGLQYSDSMNYGIKMPDGKVLYPNKRGSFENDGWTWKWSKEKVEWGLENGFIDFTETSDGYNIKYKVYELVDNEGNPRQNIGRAYVNTILDILNTEGSRNMTDLFDGKRYFSNLKPVELIKKLINVVNNQDDIILDFFSGSATTAQATMEMNAEDGGNRKYIMVQLDETIQERETAYKDGYRSIDEIGRLRIEKAAEKIKKETNLDIDYGYKTYFINTVPENTINRLEEFDPNGHTNLLSVDFSTEAYTFNGINGRETILTTLLNKNGYGLGVKFEPYRLDSYEAIKKDNSLYIIDEGLTSDDVMALVKDLENSELNINRVVIYAHSISVYDPFEDTMDLDTRTTEDTATVRDDTDRSFWEEIKDMFTMDDDREMETTDDDFLAPYREDIRNGYTVIAVRNYTGDTEVGMGMADTEVEPIDRDVHDTTKMTENEKIQLKEERLQVDKEEVQTGEVHVTKKTVHNTETIEVPVEREEVVVERRSVGDSEVDMTDTDFDDDTESITIPVHEEKVTIDKDTVVTEEVEIKKEHEEDVEHISEDIRREEIDIESSGNVRRTDTNLDDETLDINRSDSDLDDPDKRDRI